MATNSSGITISVQAKVEGWQAELKRIQAEAEKINLGTSLGKDLSRYLSTLEKQINSMGKNLTQNFTSDAAIDRFGNKVEDIEERFQRVGQILSGIQFGDLNVDYVSAQLGPLIEQVDQLQSQLNDELNVAWGDRIAGEATKIQKAFARIGQSEEDIKNLGHEGTRSVLEEMVTSAIKQADEASEKIKNLQHNIAELKKAERDWQPNTFAKEANVGSYVSSIVSKDPTSYGFTPVINEQALKEVKEKIEKSVSEIKLSDAKKQEIQNYLKDLVPENSVEIIRKRIGSIEQVLKNVTGRAAFGLDSKSFDKYLSSIFNEVDYSAIDANLSKIKERFIADGITEADLDKFWGSFSDAIKNQDFDKAIDIVSTNLTALQGEYKSGKDKIIAERLELENALKIAQSDQFRASWTRTFGEEALKELDALIDKYTKASDTAKQLNKAQKDLDQKTGDLVQQPNNIGKDITYESSQRYKELISEIQDYKAELADVQAKEQLIGKIQGVAQRWFSIYAAVRLVENAIKSVISTVTELDNTITEIAIVTDMGQNELWRQMPQYTALAQQYAASISGVYQVSQLYYQQGLDTVEVMKLTEQTLKMARISGLDYAQATDYMTNAIRSFKMEMSDAQSIVDVYSAIAAASATDTTELASAMSKTASSAQAVGSSFEDTTAMMAVMIEATRESAENIGSAMKSIISRYGEMTSDPSKLVDSEGEVMSLNRVDTALQTVGITIHDTEGKFRSFSDVIVELAEKWDTIDTNTQRYIATTMAGNRQQSRFLALVSSGDRLNELMTIADESEDASQLQYLKTLDSITAKTQQLQTSLQTLYTNTGVENWYKSLLDTANNVLATFNKMPTVFNLPIAAIANFGIQFYNIASVVTTVVSMIKNDLVTQAQQVQGLITEKTREASEEQIEITRAKVQAQEQIEQEGAERRANITAGKTVTGTTKTIFGREVSSQTYSKLSLAARAAGTALSFVAAGMNETTTTARVTKGALEGVSGALSAIGYWMSGNPFMAIVSGVMAAVNMINTIIETSEERAERLSKAAEEANNKRIQANADYKDLQTEIDKLKELDKARHDSVEAAEEYFTASAKIAESMPELVSSYDTEGNAIIDLQNAYEKLSLARQKAAEAGVTSAKAAVNNARNSEQEAKKVYIQALDTAVGQEFGLEDNDDISTLIKESSDKRDSENQIITSIAKIANTMRYNENYDTVIGENSLLDSFITALGSGNQEVLYNINSNEELSAQLINEINSINNDLGEAGELWKETINDLYSWIFGEEVNKELKGSKIKLNQAAATADASVYNAIVQHTNSRVQEQVLDARYGHGNQVDYLSKFSGAIDIINQKMISLAKEQEKPEEWIESTEAEKKYQEIEKSMQSWWDGLFPDEQQVYNDLIKNRGNYTDTELENTITDIPAEFHEAFLTYIKNTYTTEDFLAAIDTRINSNENSIAEYFSDLISNLGGTELKKSLITLDQIDKLISSEQISKTTGEEIANAYVSLLTEGNEAVQQAVLDGDIFSTAGITRLVNTLSDATKFDQTEVASAISTLQTLGTLIPININTETQLLISNFTDGLDDLEKSLKNVSKGMDFKTMYSEAQKLDKEISDFKFEDGKYYIADYVQLANDLIDKSLGGLEETRTRLQSEAEKINQQLPRHRDKKDIQDKLKITDQKKFDELWSQYQAELPETDFVTWYYQQQLADFEETAGKAEEYIKNYVASTALESGDITSFLKLILGKQFEELELSQQEALITAVASGDISKIREPELRAALEKYSGLIYDTFASARKSVVNSLIASIGDDGTNLIKVTDTNKKILEDLQAEGKGWVTGNIVSGNYVTIEAEKLTASASEFQNYIAQSFETQAEKIKALGEFHKNQYSNSVVSTFEKVYGEETFGYEDLLNYITATQDFDVDYDMSSLDDIMQEIGLAFNSVGDVIITNYDAWIEDLRTSIDELEQDGATTQEINAIKAKLDVTEAAQEVARKSAVESILKNYQAFSGEDLEKLANALGEDYDQLKQAIVSSPNRDGTFRLDIPGIIEKLNTQKISEATANTLNEIIAGIADDYLSAITNAVKYNTQGVSKMADMEKFTNQFNSLIQNANYEIGDLFNYDTILDSFVLKDDKLKEYIEVQKEQLKALNWSDKAIDEYIKDQTTKTLQTNFDVTEFLNEIDYERKSKEATKLFSQMKSIFASRGENVPEQVFQWWLEDIDRGGKTAVETLKRIKGEEVTKEEIEAVYNASINRLRTAEQELGKGVGETITGLAAQIYKQVNKNTDEIKYYSEIGNGDIVIEAIGDMVDAYIELYVRMKKNAQSTTADLNSVYAKLLTAEDQQNIDILDALQNAQGMTYDALGQLLTKYNQKLEDYMNTPEQFGLEETGFGKVKIIDWEAFAKSIFKVDNLKLVENTDEYTEAFKQYNQSLIELDRKTAKNIKSELDSILNAKSGDLLDLSWISKAISKRVNLNDIVSKYGGYIDDNLLKLSEAADISGMVNALIENIQKYADENSKLIDSELAELQDAVDSFIQNLIGQIRNGINGTLSHADVNKLKEWAFKNGLQDLDFNETAEGLKLTEASVFALYTTTKKLNRYQARNLLPDMMKMSSRYSDLIGATKEFNKALTEAATQQRENKLQGLADIIKSALQNPETYNLMSQPLPTEWQIAKNFYESASQGLQVLQSASKKGFMGIEDFYSMVHTASSLNPNFSVAGMNGDELLNAAAANLQIVNGKLQINLKKAGLKSSKEFKEFREGWLEGLEFLRKTESGYLKLGERLSGIHEIINSIEPINISNLFTSNTGEFTTEATDWMKNLSKVLSETLGSDFIDDFLINGVSFSQLLAGNIEDWISAGFKTDNGKIDQVAVQSFIKGLSQIDFNSDDIVQQFEDLLNGKKQYIEIPTENGFVTIRPTGEVITVDLSSKEVQNNLKKYLGDEYKKYNKEDLIDLVEKEWKNYNSLEMKQANLENKIKARVIIGIASGEIDYSNIKKDKNKNWTTTFQGHTLSGGSKDEVANQMGQILTAQELGWTLGPDGIVIDENKQTKVVVKKKFGGITVTWDMKNNKFYGPDGTEYKDYDDMVQKLIESGNFDEGERTIPVKGGGELNVKYNKKLGIYYTIIKDDKGNIKGYTYNNQTFNSLNDLKKFVAEKEKYEELSGDSGTVEGNNITFTIGTKAQIILQVEGSKIKKTFIFNGIPFDNLSDEAYDALIKASEQDNANIFHRLEDDTVVATYEVDGAIYTIEYNAEGKLHFTCVMPDGSVIIANSSEEFDSALKAYDAITSNKTNGNNSGGFTIKDVTIDGAKYTITVDSAGNVVVTDSAGNQIEGELKKKIEDTVKGTTVPVTGEDVKTEVTGVTTTIETAIKGIDGTVKIKIDTKTAVNSLTLFTNWFKSHVIKSLTKAINITLNIVGKKADTEIDINTELNDIKTLLEGFEKLEPKINLELIGKKGNVNTDIYTELNNIQTTLTSLNDDEHKINIVIPEELSTALQNLKNNIQYIVDNPTPTSTITINNNEDERGKLQEIVDNLKKVPGLYLALVNILTLGVDTLQNAVDLIAGLKGKTVHNYIYTHYITTGRGGCFVAGTKIYMADGTVRNIEDIYLDDIVMAYNPQTNEFVPKKVIDGYTHHNTARIVEITFSDGTILKMTPSHPILTTKGWRSLDPIISLDEHGILPGWLEIGDSVISYNGEVQITNIQELSVPKNFDTYDFEVEDCHTFLAEGIPVHNAMITGPARAADGDGGGGKPSKAKGSPTWRNPAGGLAAAKGTTGPARGAGHRTETLMGELGPEMYVSGGRYHIVGTSGAEFVNLPDDAIVFNHIQTRRLMAHGVGGHGTPVTNERNAIAFVKGTGPAKVTDTMGGLTINVSGSKTSSSGGATVEASGADRKKIISAVSSLISDVINKGFEKINLEDYEDIPDEVRAIVEKYASSGQYRQFIKEVAQYAEKTIREINEFYLEALQKELGMKKADVTQALQSITITGDRIDFDDSTMLDLIGEHDWNELYEKGIVKYDDITGQYYANFLEFFNAVPEMSKNASYIPGVQAAVTKGLKSVQDHFKNAITDGMDALEKSKFDIELRSLGINPDEIEWETDMNGMFVIKDIDKVIQQFGEKYQLILGKELDDTNNAIIERVQEEQKRGRGAIEAMINGFDWDPYYDAFLTSYDELAEIYSKQGRVLNKAWVDSLEHTADGKLKLTREQMLQVTEGMDWSDTTLQEQVQRKLEDDAKARETQIQDDVANIITTVIDQSYDAIDWRDYHDLPSEVIEAIKAQANSSRREFVEHIADATEKTIHEINEWYFQAWEKDINLSPKEATKNMQYYANGGMSGSSSDWEALLGDTVKVSELVKAGLLEYNEVLGTYYSNNWAAIAELTGVDIDINVIVDSIHEAFKTIGDKIKEGLNGELTHVDMDQLWETFHLMGLGNVQLKFEQGLEGIKLAQETVISLYQELKKVDSIQAELTFRDLNESLKETNDHYKTTQSVMMRIVELQKKIDDADENVSDERLKMYKEELEVAKEILQVRATSEDDSFNFLDKEIPGAMNNPLNYVNNWITGWRELRDAANENSPVDFTHMYNMINEINNAAGMAGEAVNFFGYTLSGSLEDADAAIQGAINALGSDTTGAYGVMLSEFGDGLESGVDSYANSADEALHLMAKVQMKVLDALIQMFEAIVAMEEFEGADINMDGLLDIGEVFSDAAEKANDATYIVDKFQLAAVNLKDKMDKNSALAEALSSVKMGGYSLKELIEDAADGIRDLPLSADQFAAAFSLLYSAFKNGDFDLNNIAESLREQLALHPGAFTGTLEYGDFILNLQYNVQIKKNEKGEYVTPSGQTYTNVDDAVHAAALEQIGAEGEKITVDPVTHIATGSIEISDTEVKVEAKASGIYYTVGDGKAVGTKEEAIYAVFQQETGGEGDFAVWKLEKGITARMTIDKVDVSNITSEQVKRAVGTTWDEVKAEWEAGKDENGENLTFEAKYGVSLTDTTTEKDWENFKQLIGVETKNVEINAIINNGSEETGLISAIETGEAHITLAVTLEETQNLSEEIADGTVQVNADLTQAKTDVDTFTNETNQTSSTVAVDGDTTQGEQKAEALKNMIAALRAIITVEANDKASPVIQSIIDLLRSMPSSKTVTVTTVEKKVTEESGETQAKGNAMASGTKTLMGELGPELYVTNGRYYVAGQNGAEFVNLPDDAIVFNHLQTKKLLESGSSGRGHAVTTEERAVAYARGSLGPAAADARQTLATLKQIRAMWAKLAEASIADLAGINSMQSIGPWLAEVERWYNLLQKIAQLEKEINYQEALRSKIESDRNANGREYYATQKALLANYMDEANAYRELAESQQAFFDQRRAELNERSAPLAKLYKFDESGQLKFEEGAYAFLSGLFEPDDYGRPKYTAKQQYQILTNSPYGDFSKYMEYDSSGNKILPDESDKNGDQLARDRVQAFWERIEAERVEMQELHDSIEDAKVKFLEAETEGNKLLQEIVDNQLKVEDSILSAIEDREQAIIDSLKEEKEQLQKNNQAYIEGLRNALNKEREMYQQNEDKNDLTRLQRRLAILQRSGGSSTEIRSLQDQIRDKQQDMYFDIQEKEIDSINEAADAQMKRLDTQIELLTDTLEFEKEHGMLWTEAQNIMNGTTSSILSFLVTNTADWQSKSALGQAEELKQLRFQVDQWTAYRDDFNTTVFNTKAAMANGFDAVADANYSPQDYSEAMATSEEWRAAVQTSMEAALVNTGNSSTGSGGGKTNNKTTYSGLSLWQQSGPSKYTTLPDELKSKYTKPEKTEVKEETKPQQTQEQAESKSENAVESKPENVIESKPEHDINAELERQKIHLKNLQQDRKKYDNLTFDDLDAENRDYLANIDYQIKETNQRIKTLETYPDGYDWEAAFAEYIPFIPNQIADAAYVKAALKQYDQDWNAFGGLPTPEQLAADSALAKYYNEYLLLKDKYDHYNKMGLYKEGGLADYTGLAMVHGTKAHPEAFLNAKQTQMWKQKVLGSDSSSLTSRLLELNNILAGIERVSSYIGETGNGDIIIEKAEVNVNVQELANSYDARQAGQDIMHEIVQIARKSGAGTNIRR